MLSQKVHINFSRSEISLQCFYCQHMFIVNRLSKKTIIRDQFEVPGWKILECSQAQQNVLSETVNLDVVPSLIIFCNRFQI